MTTALVTGATAGIGRAFVDRLAHDGHDVVLVARDEARLRQVADEVVAAHGVSAEVLPADLADHDQCASVEARLADPAAPVGLLVNNAGFGLNTPFAQSTVTDEERQLDVLVRAVLRLTHASVKGMVTRREGAVVNVASVAAFVPFSTYSAHKAWVTTFSQSLALDLQSHGVKVMALCPGFVRTEFHERMDMSTSDIPSWSWLDAETVVDAAMRDLARGRSLSVPDLRYKTAVAATRLVPASVAGRIGRAVRR